MKDDKNNAIVVRPENPMQATQAYFDPSTVNNVADALDRLTSAGDIENVLELCRYRMIYDIATKQVMLDGKKVPMYRTATYAGKSNTRLFCANIFEFCEKCLPQPIGRSQVYNVLKVGELIQPNGKNSIFAYTEVIDGEEVTIDFNFTQLVSIVESGKDKLFDEVKDGKKVVERNFKIGEKWERAKDKDGNPLLTEDENGKPTKLYNILEGETATILQTLITMGYITPALTPKKIAQLLKENWYITKYGVKIPDEEFKQHKNDKNAAAGDENVTESDENAAESESTTPLASDEIKVTATRSDWKVLANILEKLDIAFAIDFAKNLRKVLKV